MTEAIDSLTREWQPLGALAEIQRIWPAIVGEAVARWASPVQERAGVITIACRDAMVAQELELQKVSVLARLTELGASHVTELRFVVK